MGAHEYHGGVSLLLGQLRDPLALHGAEGLRVDDVEAHEEDVTARVAEFSQRGRVRGVLAGGVAERHMHRGAVHFHFACGSIRRRRRE